MEIKVKVVIQGAKAGIVVISILLPYYIGIILIKKTDLVSRRSLGLGLYNMPRVIDEPLKGIVFQYDKLGTSL